MQYSIIITWRYDVVIIIIIKRWLRRASETFTHACRRRDENREIRWKYIIIVFLQQSFYVVSTRIILWCYYCAVVETRILVIHRVYLKKIIMITIINNNNKHIHNCARTPRKHEWNVYCTCILLQYAVCCWSFTHMIRCSSSIFFNYCYC